MERLGHLAADVASGAVVVGHFILNGMPTIATALAIVWYAIQITAFAVKTQRVRRMGRMLGKEKSEEPTSLK